MLFGRFLVYSLKFDRMTEPKEVNILIETGKAGQRFFSKNVVFMDNFGNGGWIYF